MNLKNTRKWCAAAHGTQGYGNTATDDGGMDGFHPYRFHLDKTEQVAVRFGFRKAYGIRKGCQMHDVFEDTKKTRQDALAAGFDPYEIGLAWACTDGHADNRHERKLEAYRKIRLTPDAVIVKLCDRIANLEHAILVGYTRKVNLYLDEMEEFERHLKGAPVSNPEYQPKVDALWARLHWLFSEEARNKLWGTRHCCKQPDDMVA